MLSKLVANALCVFFLLEQTLYKIAEVPHAQCALLCDLPQDPGANVSLAVRHLGSDVRLLSVQYEAETSVIPSSSQKDESLLRQSPFDLRSRIRPTHLREDTA